METTSANLNNYNDYIMFYDNNSQNFYISKYTGIITCIPVYDPYPWYIKHYTHFCPIVYEKDKINIAFKIIKKLYEEKIINPLSVNKFIEIVHKIAEEI